MGRRELTKYGMFRYKRTCPAASGDRKGAVTMAVSSPILPQDSSTGEVRLDVEEVYPRGTSRFAVLRAYAYTYDCKGLLTARWDEQSAYFLLNCES